MGVGGAFGSILVHTILNRTLNQLQGLLLMENQHRQVLEGEMWARREAQIPGPQKSGCETPGHPLPKPHRLGQQEPPSPGGVASGGDITRALQPSYVQFL